MNLFTTAALGQSRQSKYTSHFRPQTIDSNIAIGYGIALGDVNGDTKPDILVSKWRLEKICYDRKPHRA